MNTVQGNIICLAWEY